MLKQGLKNKQQSNVSDSPTIFVDPQRSYKVEQKNEAQNLQEHYVPSYRDIEVLAYQIHEEKGGTDLDNWLEAEQILKEKNCAGGC